MGLFESLYTGVMGMNAQSKSTGMISTNIANQTTVGYKKSEAAFHDLFASSMYSGNYSHGGVYATEVHRHDIQGQIQQTVSTTDAAINGSGFFAGKKSADPSAEFFFTRNGTFNPDADGILRNSAGFVLYGVPLSQGLAPSGEISGGIDSLEPVDIDILNSQAVPTTLVTQVVNLNAAETAYNSHILSGGTLPIGQTQAAHFSRNQTVIDGQGNQRQITLEYRKITGPMAYATGDATSEINATDVLVDNAAGPTPGITAGDTLSVSAGTGTLTITFVNGNADTSLNQANTMQDVMTILNTYNGGTGAGDTFDASLDDSGNFILRAVDPTASLNLGLSSASVTGANGFNFIPDPISAGSPLSYDPMASLTANGTANPNQTDFPAFANTTNPNTRGWWEVTILTNDPAGGSTPVEVSRGLLNFDGNGTLNASAGANGEVNLALNNLDFDSSQTGEEISLTIEIGSFSQFSGAYNVTFTEQNGIEPGTLSQVSIDNEGRVLGTYSNGTQLAMYQIPLATFTNPNGLVDLSGTIFRYGFDAGDLTLSTGGTEGAGLIRASSIENSNVDLADEFATLIVSQRAFQANSRVVNTVDEMTEQLRSLKQ